MRCDASGQVLKGQRPGDKPAQGNALGTVFVQDKGLKGRDKLCRPFRALILVLPMTQGVALGWLVFAPLVLLAASPWTHIRLHRKKFPSDFAALAVAHTPHYSPRMITLTAPATPRLPRVRRHPPLLTSEEFLDWLQPGIHADLVGGRIHLHPPANLKYADLHNFLGHLLASYIEEESLGELHRTSVAVRLSPRETFMPDLSFFTNAQVARLPETHAPFALTWVCEVLSPSSVKRDTEQKFAAYELHRVPEYWVLDPRKLVHRFYRLHVDVLEEYAEGKDRIESVSIPGFWVKRAWLNPEKLPTVKSCLAEILRSHIGSGR